MAERPSSCFCNEKSLSYHLVKSKLNHVHEIPGTFRCNRTICNTCQFVSCRTSIDTPFRSFSIRRSFSCVSENIVYCIFCSKVIFIMLVKQDVG